jgi:hypothetical protein
VRGILISAALIFALMLVIKDGRASRNLGLTGSCHAVAAPAGIGGAWQACDPGKLEGAPDLSRYGCRAMSFVGKREYWRCPAGIKSSQNTH